MDIAFLLFLPMSGSTGMAVPARLVVGIMAVFAISELLISPIGLSVTTKLAPEAFRADDGAVLLLRRAWDVDVRCAGTLLRPGARICLLRNHRRDGHCRRHHCFRPRRQMARLMEGRALKRRGRLAQVGPTPRDSLTSADNDFPLVGRGCSSGQAARISESIDGSMLPPDRTMTVRPGGVEPRR